MLTKQDYAIAALIGFLTGVFAIPTVLNLGMRDKIILLALPLVVPPLWIFGVWLGGFLSRWFRFFAQFGKFAVVGFLNASIDFGILNLLSILTGVTAGFVIGGVNVPGFGIAALNSYFWNKFWVFRHTNRDGALSDFPKFLVVTLAGLLLNSVAVVVITTYLAPFFDASPESWLNIAKIFASAAVLAWNFLGYKFVVFRQTGSQAAS